MAHPALKRFSYFGQFGILAGFVGAGLVLAGLVSVIPLLMIPGVKDVFGDGKGDLMDKLFVPENAGILRWVQFLSTIFLFFLPPLVYAKICHKKAFKHLGYSNSVNLSQVLVVVLLMLASLPFVSMLGQLTEMMPFSEATLKKFRLAEEEYAKQVAVIGRMNNFGDYVVSLVMLAILPAVFEETLFRGGVQNLLSRWTKMPILAIIITSIVFSAIHFSYIGFLSRFALSFILGWMYYRTGNLWLNIIGHVTNNAVALTVLYVMKLNNPNVDLNKADPEFPFWLGFISITMVLAFFVLFERVSKHQVIEPGREQLMPDETINPFG
jgi:membrane protease YdiL (CAAX protease family)